VATLPALVGSVAKLTKAAADYRLADGDGRDCANCLHMNHDGTCDLVKGIVSPDYVCAHWVHWT